MCARVRACVRMRMRIPRARASCLARTHLSWPIHAALIVMMRDDVWSAIGGGPGGGMAVPPRCTDARLREARC